MQELVPQAVTGEKDAVVVTGDLTDADGVVQTNVDEPEILEAGMSFSPTGEKPLYQSLDQSKLIPILTKALQEALEKIETLETRLSDAGIA